MKYWIGVVNKEHVLLGVRDGIMQLGHGKRAPLARLHKGDWLIYYSPVQSFGDSEPLQAFTALGQVADDEIYQHTVSENFKPFRRKVRYTPVRDVPIRPLIEQLEVIKNKQRWGYIFRFGFVEISEVDFKVIQKQLLAG
jgi:predicted RNA-binding protein